MSASKPPNFRNVPPPPGGGKPAAAYTRFIPREELGDFAAWKPGSLSGHEERRSGRNLGGNAGVGSSGGGGSSNAAAASTAAGEQREATPDAWRAQVAAARQAGYQDGYRDGLAALEAFKQTFAAQATAQIGALLRSFDDQLDRLDGELAGAVARTAVQMARQVLRAELHGNPAVVAQVAAEAVNNVLLSARHITVQVHPLDLPLVAEGADEALKARGARLLADGTQQRGGVLVESDVGSVDARIASRWAQAAAAMGSDEPWDEPA